MKKKINQIKILNAKNIFLIHSEFKKDVFFALWNLGYVFEQQKKCQRFFLIEKIRLVNCNKI